jgi:hypothetical protein
MYLSSQILVSAYLGETETGKEEPLNKGPLRTEMERLGGRGVSKKVFYCYNRIHETK